MQTTPTKPIVLCDTRFVGTQAHSQCDDTWDLVSLEERMALWAFLYSHGSTEMYSDILTSNSFFSSLVSKDRHLTKTDHYSLWQCWMLLGDTCKLLAEELVLATGQQTSQYAFNDSGPIDGHMTSGHSGHLDLHPM